MKNTKQVLKQSTSEIEKYFKQKLQYDNDYSKRRNEQIDEIKSMTKSEKKSKKQKRDEHLLELV